MAYDLRATLDVLGRMLAMNKNGRTGDPMVRPVIIRNTEITLEKAGEYASDLAFLRRELRELAGGTAIDTLAPVLLNHYGTVFAKLDQADSARYWLERALATPNAMPPGYEVISRVWLATFARAAGDSATMRQQLDAVARIRKEGKVPRWQLSYYEIRKAQGTPQQVADIVRRELDSIAYGKTSSRPLVGHLVAAANAMNRVGSYAEGARYATEAVEAGRFDSLALSRSGEIGAALVARADAQVGLGDTVAARSSLTAALPPLRFGMGENHPMTLAAAARLAGLK
jgi:hypothetical protein